MRARAAALLAAVVLASASARAENEPALEVHVELDRAQVYLHEQAVLSVIVRHPAEARASWEPPPFDGFWAERIGTRGLPPDERGLPRTEFRRALFPTRTGNVEIAASKLVLVGEGGVEHEVPVPGAVLRVVPLPADVPADALVGQLEVRVVASDDRVRTGRALSITVELAGEANVWDAKPPALEPLVGPDVEVFPKAPQISIGESAGRATTRRTFRYALVPSRAGSLRLDPVRIAYFDPTKAALETAESAPLALTAFASGADSEEQRGAQPKRPAQHDLPPLPFGWLALALALSLGAAYWYAARWRRPHAALAPAGKLPSPAAAFDAALAVRETRECLPLLASALRASISIRHGFDALPLTSQEIAARKPDAEALELLRELDRARFAGRERADDALVARVRAYLDL